MLRECVENATDEVWLGGSHPRNFWRIAYHAAFYTHLYLGQTVDDYQAWEKHREGVTSLWVEENLPVVDAYNKSEIVSYIDLIDGMIDNVIDNLDLDSDSSGVPWYKEMSKLEHEILTIRHLQTHVGQLSELLMANGIDGKYWNSKG